jgi:hypothetical protein
METEELVCVKGHTYNGKWRNPGDCVEVRRRHSTVLIALGRMKRPTTNVISFPFGSVESKINNSTIAVDPVDNDETEIKATLRAEYKALFGKDAHGRTSVERLREEISKKKGMIND